MDLKIQNRKTIHENYRKLIQLNGNQNTLPQEPTSSVAHLASVIKYFQASEKFADYAAIISKIYDVRRSLSSSDKTSDASSELQHNDV